MYINQWGVRMTEKNDQHKHNQMTIAIVAVVAVVAIVILVNSANKNAVGSAFTEGTGLSDISQDGEIVGIPGYGAGIGLTTCDTCNPTCKVGFGCYVDTTRAPPPVRCKCLKQWWELYFLK